MKYWVHVSGVDNYKFNPNNYTVDEIGENYSGQRKFLDKNTFFPKSFPLSDALQEPFGKKLRMLGQFADM